MVRIICLLVIPTPPPDLGLLRALVPTMGTEQVNKGGNGEGAIEEVGDTHAFALAVAAVSPGLRKMAGGTERGSLLFEVAQPGSS